MTSGSDSPLLVPMVVDALLVNKASAGQVLKSVPKIKGVTNHEPIEPGTFNPPIKEKETGRMGIFIQWELPPVLRTGTVDEKDPLNKKASFPVIPNRWTIVRHVRPAGKNSEPPIINAWLIRGDEDAPADNNTSALFPISEEKGTLPDAVRYGVAYDLSATDTKIKPDDYKADMAIGVDTAELTAFAFYQPYNQNVLSFHDSWESLTHAQGNSSDEVTVSYFVTGWYSNPEFDLISEIPAEKDPIKEFLGDFGWSINASTMGIGKRSVYHGSVLGVPWHQTNKITTYKIKDKEINLDGMPAVGTLETAVGHSSIEAITTILKEQWLKSNDPDTNRKSLDVAHFELFQYGLHSAPSKPSLPDHTREAAADHALDYTRHDFGFATLAGGHHWQLTPTAPQSSSGISATAQTKVPSLTQAESAALQQLNADQATYEALFCKAHDLGVRAKGIWWLIDPNTEGYKPSEEDKKSYLLVASEWYATTLKLQEISKKIPAGGTGKKFEESLRKWEKENGISATRTLKPVIHSPFRQVNNPVAVFRNLQDRNRLREQDGYLTSLLPVRSLSQVSMRNASAPVFPSIIKSRMSEKSTVPEDVQSAISALYAEFFGIEQEALKKGRNDKLDLSDIAGAPPFTRWWHQPWKPVFLKWSADVYPTKMDDYELLDGTLPKYAHKKVQGQKESSGVRRQISGFDFIMPIIEENTLYRLKEHFDARSEEGSDAYKKLFEDIQKNNAWDVLSFTLCGINENLAGRTHDVPWDLAVGIEGHKDKMTISSRIDHLPLGDKRTDKIIAAGNDNALARGDGELTEARSGQVCLTELTIIDGFGRGLSLIPYNHYKEISLLHADSFEVSAETRSYSTEAASSLLELPPRLHQPARLLFEYLDPNSAHEASSSFYSDSGEAPVHGWVMATRFGVRRALLCFDPKGQPIFELRTHAGGAAKYRPLPGSAYATIEGKFAQDHKILAAFLTPLLEGTALSSLLYSIDHGLTTVAPPTSRGPDSRALSLMLGRPCALTSARLRLELKTPPLRRPTPEGLAGPAPQPSIKWPVRLGDPYLVDDGLLGYFVGGDFKKFITRYSVPETVDASRYVRSPSLGDITVVAQEGTPGVSPKDTVVSLLVCPHNSVHAASDILPVVKLDLPEGAIDASLSNMRPVLPFGPVLVNESKAGEDALVMPASTLGTDHSVWSWTQPQPGGMWAEYLIRPKGPTEDVIGGKVQALTGYMRLAVPEDFVLDDDQHS